jgi:hypothetical protein
VTFYGIKTPETPSRIWWISDSPHRAWEAFFTYPSRGGAHNSYRLPLEEAIRAYTAIGYQCVELEVAQKGGDHA